jgi:hypothetical protein
MTASGYDESVLLSVGYPIQPVSSGSFVRSVLIYTSLFNSDRR